MANLALSNILPVTPTRNSNVVLTDGGAGVAKLSALLGLVQTGDLPPLPAGMVWANLTGASAPPAPVTLAALFAAMLAGLPAANPGPGQAWLNNGFLVMGN